LFNKALEYLRAYCEAKKYGKITLHIEGGKVTRITTEESIKL